MGTGFFGSYFKRKTRDEDSSVDDAESRSSGSNHSLDPREGGEVRTKSFFKFGLGSPPQNHVKDEENVSVTKSASESPSVENVQTARPPETQRESYRNAESALTELAHDNIVTALLKEEIITMSQALKALKEHRNLPDSTLWRILAELKGVDKQLIYETAAVVSGYRSIKVDEENPSFDLLEAIVSLFPGPLSDEMLQYGILPCEIMAHPGREYETLVFACCDPGHPKVQQFAQTLMQHVEVRYAPDTAIKKKINELKLRRRSLVNIEQEAESCEGRNSIDTPNSLAKENSAQYSAENDLAAVIHTDRIASDNTILPDQIEPSTPEIFSGDGHHPGLEFLPEPSVEQPASNPSENPADEIIESTPTLQRTGWTGNPEPEKPSVAPVDKSVIGKSVDAAKAKDRVVAMLLRKELVTPEQVYEAQQNQKRDAPKEALWRLITLIKDVDRESVFAEAARVYAFPVAVLHEGQPDPDFARSVVETFPEDRRQDLFRLRVLPFECDVEHQTGAIKLVFITHDPTRPDVHRLMQQLKLERFELRYASEAVVTTALLEAFPRKNEYLERMSEGTGAFDLGMSYDETSKKLLDEEALDAEINRSTLINLFEATLVEAVRQGASDIHIYPNASKKVEIHFRVDGRLHIWHTEEKVHPEALLAVIKDNATNVDRFERDAAQDGFIQRWIDDVLIRFRVSVLPIANASQEIRSESIVIRVLDDRKVITTLRSLGLLELALKRFDEAIHQPHGMVILTGPTGSGKSTTLVAALHQVVTPEVNVLTVEDPVEYIIPGVRQIKLNHKLGLEDALRSILRHDPDIVMVGEMRDRQTAELAIKLANTGHLTFSTLHTNDSPSAISRLYKMGIEPFLIAYAINLVVAQRLIRTLCPTCKEVDNDPDEIMLAKLGFSEEDISKRTIYKPGHDASCKTCKGVGYKGRRAVSEALHFSREIRHMIVEADRLIDEEAIRQQAVKEGMLTLRDSAREIVKLGETSVMEMIRVITSES